MHHLTTNPETEELDCLRKKCYQVEVKYELIVNQWFGQLYIENTCECAYQELHQSAKKFWCWNFFFSGFFLFLQDSVVG